MTTYFVSIGKNEYKIEINNDQFKVNGETIQAALTELGERGLYLLRHGTWRQELHVQPQGPSRYGIDINGRHMLARVEKSSSRARKNSGQGGAGDLTAPMPGVVIRVDTAVGDTVEQGQVLVVLESMKMQMLMSAPCRGKVVRVNARPSGQMAKGDVLVKIEPEAQPSS